MELNIQIILCGLVFVVLPLFLIAALFKVSLSDGLSPPIGGVLNHLTPSSSPQVGNLANDGVKLGTSSHTGRRCSADPHDGLEEESKGGTVRYFSITFHSSGPRPV